MTQLSTYYKTQQAQAILNAIDAGESPGNIMLFNGPVPLNCAGTTGSNTLLATFTLSKPCGTLTGTILSLWPAAAALIAGTGTPTFMRVINSLGNIVVDVTADVMSMNDSNLVAGNYLSMSYIKFDTSA